MKRAFKISLGVLGAVGAGLLIAAWYASEQVIHPPQKPLLFVPGDFPHLQLEPVEFQSRDGIRLAGWFVRGTKGATIVLAHGRASTRSEMLPHADYLNRAGYSVLLFDFRYRGESGGDAQTLGFKEAWDVQAAVEYLQTRSDVDSSRIGLLGESMGAVASILAAAKTPAVRGVVAQIPYADLKSIVCHSFRSEFGLPCFPLARLTKWFSEIRTGVDLDQISAEASIGRISPRPVFLIDEERDQRFPVDSVERLFRAAGEPKSYWLVEGAAHGTAFETAPQEYERRVVAFWKTVFEAD